MMHRTTLLALLASAIIGIALFALKYQVRDLEAELTGINRQIIAHREAIHVLNAEWSHLNDPGRLAALASRHLQLQPTTSDRLGSIASLPMAGEAAAPTLAVATQPLAAAKVVPLPQRRVPVVAPPASGDEDFTPGNAEAAGDERATP